jgi:membrane-bound lytic murein transglycosylase MltF
MKRWAPTLLLSALAACGGQPAPAPAASPTPATVSPTPAVAKVEPKPALPPFTDRAPLADEGFRRMRVPWQGDLAGMVKRRNIRFLVAVNPMLYSVDKGKQTGVTYEAARQFEDTLNARMRRGSLKVHVVFIPVARDRLLTSLAEGLGDVAAANLTVTEARKKTVAFTAPFSTNVSEIVVGGPSSPPLTSLDDLSGKEVFVRLSSSYAESLRALNQRFATAGRAPVKILAADERLESSDALEMVNAGLVAFTVADTHIAEFWAKVWDGLKVYPDLKVRSGAEVAWAVRKGSPKLKAAIDSFVATHKQGTRAGNVLLQKYLKSTGYVKNASSEADMKRFKTLVQFFQRYGREYDFDWLLLAAQGYQESRLDQTVKSKAGAIGVMQVMPATARSRSVGIPDISTAENNVHAGTKYLRYLVDHNFNDPKIGKLDRMLFAFAAYNAGPGRVSKLRAKATKRGLKNYVWFDNVETIAARDIGRETVQYVSNIFKYYIAYKLTAEREQEQAQARARPQG